MCGIFGLLLNSKSRMKVPHIKAISSDLLNYSESRGKEATGIALKYENYGEVLKSPHSAKHFIKSEKYNSLFRDLQKTYSPTKNEPLILIGHSRLVTNGTQKDAKNNQPVTSKDLICIHNGIIVNHANLWQYIPKVKKESEVDTEVFIKIVNNCLDKKESLLDATKFGLNLIEGAASLALFQKNKSTVILATNTGSLYYIQSLDLGIFIFASEERFLKSLLKKKYFSNKEKSSFILKKLKPGRGIALSLETLKQKTFAFSLSTFNKTHDSERPLIFSSGNIPFDKDLPLTDSMKRCTKCILPQTMPFITFDAKGVCSYCQNYKPYICKPIGHLEEILDKYRKKDGSPDCIVAFSGGRDSSYGLHLIKNHFQLNPLAVTYDWGVVTDLARRNQARMCGSLGIEHILVSANIEKKRLNIKKNLEAWLRKPTLGMLPLLMAGDKQFFYYANKLAKLNNIQLILFCVNPLEKTEFKSGFSGVNQLGKVIFNQISIQQNFTLLSYYIKNFIKEPKYLNSSLIDTACAYFVSYFMHHPFIQLFDYYRWNEEEINEVLIKDYNWETDPTTTTTWRIGDGTAAFYNYIYSHLVGFTENDTFRSNQIREGIITRNQALRLIQEENKPRYESIHAYLSLLDVDFEKSMRIINDLPKLY